MNATTDPNLIERVKDWRQDEGWRQFYERYAPGIAAHARRSGLSPEEAEDVVQATMLKVATYLPRFEYDRTICKFRTWLNQIVNQRIVSIWKERRKSQLSEQARVELSRLIGSDRSTGEDQAIRTEFELQLLQVCLTRVRALVKPKHWQIFETHVLAHLTAKEVARMFETTAANVWVIRHRLVRRLRKEWITLLEDPFPSIPGPGRL